MERWSSRAYAALAVAVGAAVLLAGPQAWTAGDVVVLALVGLALAAWGSATGALVPSPVVVPAARSTQHPPVLRGRATDPVHHPLAPRAPGLR